MDALVHRSNHNALILRDSAQTFSTAWVGMLGFTSLTSGSPASSLAAATAPSRLGHRPPRLDVSRMATRRETSVRLVCCPAGARGRSRTEFLRALVRSRTELGLGALVRHLHWTRGALGLLTPRRRTFERRRS